MKILCVIPSRLASTRLPQKPLASIQGKPMIQWVYERASKCAELTRIVVATDSQAIAEVVQAVGGHVEMTDPALKTGSDRVAAVAARYPDMDVILNLQGDQPFIKASMLRELIAPYLAGENPDMTTLACPLDVASEHKDPNVVKVIVDQRDNAIYFSRAPIPYPRSGGRLPVWQHLGLYAFRRDFLLAFTNLPQTPLEEVEVLEQLRALEHGYRIRVCYTQEKILEINTTEELARAQAVEFT
jgi:3-deoxy-manno-octulosonate cytidylyltransferase (CMP-KDO synthetase)